MSAAALYDDRVMDHIKNARNYRALDDADRRGEAVSQVCGDSVTVYLKLTGDRITGIGFQCVSCGICMASASMMTELIGGRTTGEARMLVGHCAAALEGTAAASMEGTANAAPERQGMAKSDGQLSPSTQEADPAAPHIPGAAANEGRQDAIELSAEQRAVFATLQAFPARKTCAWVSWAALSGALRDDSAPQTI